jgi:hypothetical protein
VPTDKDARTQSRTGSSRERLAAINENKMRKLIILGLCTLIISCHKDDNNLISKRNAGRFLKAIYNMKDTVSGIKTLSRVYNYNSDNNLTEILWYSDYYKDSLLTKYEFEYNQSNRLIKLSEINQFGHLIVYELFYYKGDFLTASSAYFIYVPTKTYYLGDTINYEYANEKLTKRSHFGSYEYENYDYDNAFKNVIQTDYYENDTLKVVIKDQYDDKINPLAKLNLPFFDISIDYELPFFNISGASGNNVVKEDYNAIKANHKQINGNWSYTIIEPFQYDSLGYPIKCKNYNFEYIDLK